MKPKKEVYVTKKLATYVINDLKEAEVFIWQCKINKEPARDYEHYLLINGICTIETLKELNDKVDIGIKYNVY